MAAVEAVTRGLVNKFLHHPLQALKAAARDGDSDALDIIREAFHLNPTIEPPGSAPSLKERILGGKGEKHD
jgi:glutamyl-tRNA reductase